MDKRTVLGLVAIGAILFAFTWYNSREQQKAIKERYVQDSIALVNWEAEYAARQRDSLDRVAVFGGADGETAVSDDASAGDQGLYLRRAVKGEEEILFVENEVFKVGFSTLGGKVESVELKGYKSYEGDPLQLIAENSSRFNLAFNVREGYNDILINTGDYNFECLDTEGFTLGRGDAQRTLVMRLPIDSVSYLDFIYTFKADDYMIGFRVDFSGMQGRISPQWPNIEFDWGSQSYQNEKGFDNENNNTTVAYRFSGKNGIELLGSSKSSKSAQENSKVDWVAFKQQFFSSVFLADNEFVNSEMGFTTFEPSSGRIKDFSAQLSVPYSSSEQHYDFRFYYGPNRFSTLRQYGERLERLVPLGGWLIGWINKWIVIPVFDFLGRYIASFGIIILILTIIIKIVISPLTYKSYLSSAKMRLLKPEVDALNEKYPRKEDAMKKQQAMMTLYKQAGVNPMGGCIPILIQFPILIAMFRFFPASIELRGESFLWADDLSSYDSILRLPFEIPFYGSHVSLFALLMGVSMYLASKINYNQQAASAPQMAGMKFMMLYMMPVMMVLWLNNFSSGLSYYYLLSNIITIGQTFAFRYAVDDQKLHARMKANAKKPVKKSKFQQRMEDIAKQQQAQQRQVQQARKQRKK